MLFQLITILFSISLGESMLLPRYRRIRELEEVVTEISPNQDARYYIRLSNRSAPFFMYVTPCGSAVHWQIFAVHSDIHKVMQFSQFTDSPHVELIAGEAGDHRMTFFSPKLSSERVLIVLRAGSNASVRLFVANSQQAMDDHYPPLPSDTRVAQAVAAPIGDTSSVLLNWKLHPAVRDSAPGQYRICAIVSRKENVWAMCDHVDDALESIHCTDQHKNTMQIDKLRNGKHYFVNVFVRDSRTGATSSYNILEVDVQAPKKSSPKPSAKQVAQKKTLSDGVLVTESLPSKKGASLVFNYLPPAEVAISKRMLLVVHACDGYIRMNVYRNGRLVKKSEPFTGFRRFLVLNARSGLLQFQIVNDDNRVNSVRMWGSTHPETSPYPSLPDDTTIKVTGRSCSSATLQWMRAPDSHVEYCLYKRREQTSFLEELVSKVDNLCAGGLSSSSLVGCYAHRGGSSVSVEGLLETRVDGLRPLSTYRFDILARPLDKPLSRQLPYRTVWVKTTRTC